MKYGELEFKDFSISTELKEELVELMTKEEIIAHLYKVLTKEIEEIKNETLIDFNWYIEVEDMTTVYLDANDCSSYLLIGLLKNLITEKFGKANIFIYLNNDDFDCISDIDEDFNFDLLG